MRSPLPPRHDRARAEFWSATQEDTLAIVASECAWFAGHWCTRRRRSVRCHGETCFYCGIGDELRVFAYVWLELPDGRRVVFELPRRARDLVEAWYGQGPGLIGTEVQVWRDGEKRNSPVTVLVTGRRVPVEGSEIWNLVQRLGVDVPQHPAGASREGANREPSA